MKASRLSEYYTEKGYEQVYYITRKSNREKLLGKLFKDMRLNSDKFMAVSVAALIGVGYWIAKKVHEHQYKLIERLEGGNTHPNQDCEQ